MQDEKAPELTTDAAIDEAADIAGEMGRDDIAMTILRRLHSRCASKRKRPALVLIDHRTGEIVWREPQE